MSKFTYISKESKECQCPNPSKSLCHEFIPNSLRCSPPLPPSVSTAFLCRLVADRHHR